MSKVPEFRSNQSGFFGSEGGGSNSSLIAGGGLPSVSWGYADANVTQNTLIAWDTALNSQGARIIDEDVPGATMTVTNAGTYLVMYDLRSGTASQIWEYRINTVVQDTFASQNDAISGQCISRHFINTLAAGDTIDLRLLTATDFYQDCKVSIIRLA